MTQDHAPSLASTTPPAAALACRCGAVRGTIADIGPDEGDRLVCCCSDCQAFARFCNAEDYALNDYGGTDLYQTRCARVAMGQGLDTLACVHLTAEATLRWYCSICRSPLFNTYANGKVPYVTAILANVDERDRALAGPVKGHFFVEDAWGHHDLKNLPMRRIIPRLASRILRDVLSGDRRRTDLFDPRTLLPIAVPHRLTDAERSECYASREGRIV